VKILASKNIAMPSSLYCSEITLKPGTGFVPRISTCVEIYYVISGKGLIRHGYTAMQEIFLEARNHVVVRPWE
jgi:hypothetical protein